MSGNAIFRPSSEANVVYVRYLAQVEGRVLGLRIHNEPPHRRRKPAAPTGRLRVEEALHPFVLEARGLPVEGSFGNTGLLCLLGHGASEQDQRAYHLVVLLLGPQEQWHQRFPFVGLFDAASVGPLRARTLPPLTTSCCVSQEEKHATDSDLRLVENRLRSVSSSVLDALNFCQRYSTHR